MPKEQPADSFDKDDVEELSSDPEVENETAFTSTLVNINKTMLAMSESLKRLHQQQDSGLPSVESAKKAKLATASQSESDTTATTDVRMLLESSTDETGADTGCSDEAEVLLTEIETVS
jgi:hypothetical protein